MKLHVLAVAVAASLAFPMAAQADGHEGLKISGDITVAYDTDPNFDGNDSDAGINENGSEINFDGTSEVGGITYMGHAELDFQGTGAAPNFEEVRVGAKGGFGEVWLGEVDNACDQFDPGSNDIWLGGQSASCGGSDASSILYKNSMGGAEFAVSHNPGADESAIGARFGAGPVKINLGYEDLSGTDLISYGVAGKFGDIELNAEGNDNDDWGVNASYSANNNTFWLGYGDDGTNDKIGAGYRMSHGKMDYIIEFADDGNNNKTIAGMRYNF